MKGAIGWLLVAAGSAIIITGSAICVAGCAGSAPPAQIAYDAYLLNRDACKLVEDIAGSSTPGIVTAECTAVGVLPVAQPAPAPAKVARVQMSQTAWWAIQSGATMTVAPVTSGPADAGADG